MPKARPKGNGRRGAAGSGVRQADPTDGPATATGNDLRSLARDAALAALKRLADLSRSDDERVALAATQELLNRAFGRASVAGGEDAAAATQPLIIKIVKFTETDLSDSQGDK